MLEIQMVKEYFIVGKNMFIRKCVYVQVAMDNVVHIMVVLVPFVK